MFLQNYLVINDSFVSVLIFYLNRNKTYSTDDTDSSNLKFAVSVPLL